MSSSTFNSERARSDMANPDMPGSDMSSPPESGNQRRVFGRILIVILAGMVCALLLFRLLTIAFDASADTILGRVTEARKALPKILEQPEDLVMVYGSSMVQAGYSPRQFDAEMSERGVNVKSFNFGFGGLNPFFQELLARRIRDAFVENDRRLKLVVIEFNPFQTTTTRWQRALPAVDSFVTMLASPSELFRILLEDPRRGLRLLTIRYLRNEISAEMTTSFFSQGLRPPRPRADGERDPEIADRLDEVGQALNEAFEKDYPDYDGADWSWEWQGGGTIPEERSAETLALVDEFYQLQNADKYRLASDRLSRIHTADIIDLNFEPKLEAAFIEMVKVFQTFSDQVEVVMLPKNTRWIQNPPEALERQRAIIARIERATGVRVRDYQVMESIPPEYFSDTTHLNRYNGAVAFTSLLVSEFADDLR